MCAFKNQMIIYFIFIYICLSLPEDFFFFPLIAFREGGRERKKYQLVAFSYVPQLGIEPVTLVCALTGHQSCSLSVYGMMLQPSHTGQGDIF